MINLKLKIQNLKLYATAIGLLILLACQSEKGKEKLLIGEWMVTSFQAGDRTLPDEMFENFRYFFNADMTYKNTMGRNSQEGTWKLNKEKTSILMLHKGPMGMVDIPNEFVIESLTEDRLTVSQNQADGLLTMEMIKMGTSDLK